MENTARKIEPEETSADALVVRSQAKVDEFKKRVQSLITVKPDKTFIVTITDADQFTLADSVKKMVEEERKTVYTDADDLCKKANILHKSLVAKRDAAVAPYDSLKNAIVAGANAYIREEKRKADEEAKRLRLEAQKQAEEEQIAQASELEAEGRIDEANEILESQPVYVAPVPVAYIPKADARSYSAARAVPVYKARVTNRLALLKSISPETLLECLNEAAWTAIESGLSRKAKALGEAFNMPGVTLTEQ